MLNYRFVSVSATTLYVFIRIHVESFNVVHEPCHGETRLCRMGESGLVIRLTYAKCSVIIEDGEPRPGPYFSVYEVLLYKCCL